MKTLDCSIIGAPVQSGAGRPGCLMGPDALRTAGFVTMLTGLGHKVTDFGNLDLEVSTGTAPGHPNPRIKNLGRIIDWAQRLEEAAFQAAGNFSFPIFLGGDHSMAIGTVPGLARAAQTAGRAQFVLWLDAHSDIHTLETTSSGNLHGTPVAYFTAQNGFEGTFPPLRNHVPPEHVCMMGIRSVDEAEKHSLRQTDIIVHDMRELDETGFAKPLKAFLETVRAANGRLHVSFDVDFLDPGIAPAVGTTVPGGPTFREAHLVMEILHESSLVTSIEIAELNPFLDHEGRTALLMTDLVASLMGRSILGRQKRKQG